MEEKRKISNHISYHTLIICSLIIAVVFLSTGWSVFERKLYIEKIALTIRPTTDIRITAITVNGKTGDAVSNWEDYNVSKIMSSINLPNSNSSITFKVNVTNYEGTEMGIFNITGLPSNLEYSMSGYKMKDKICVNTKCSLNITKDIYITIKYKSDGYKADNTNYVISLDFDFRPFHKITYSCITNNNFPSEIIEGGDLIVDNFNNKNLSFLVNTGGSVNTNYTYSNGVFILKNVLDDTNIRPFNSFTDGSGANNPKLTSGMISVVYCEECNVWVKQDITKSHNYSNQIWANAVTIVSNKRNFYQDAPNGTEIPLEDINTMWVWIPRYEYRTDNLGTKYASGTASLPGEIGVNFLSNTSSSTTTNYKLHPAFVFGTQNLTGIWFGKFEIGGSLSSACKNESCDASKILIKPLIASIRNQTISSFFFASRSMQKNNASTFGFDTTSTMDVHLSKMSDWASVTYLSQSKYGKYGNSKYTGANKEVYTNNSGSFITGSSNKTPSVPEVNTQVSYEVDPGGIGASTSGTIYGIYDMSGGASEYAMANYKYDTRTDHYLANSGFTSLPDSKYYDGFTGTTSTINGSNACNGGTCYGYGLIETDAWYDDANTPLYSSWVFPVLGGYYTSGSSASKTNGIFAKGRQDGIASDHISSRVVITP